MLTQAEIDHMPWGTHEAMDGFLFRIIMGFTYIVGNVYTSDAHRAVLEDKARERIGGRGLVCGCLVRNVGDYNPVPRKCFDGTCPNRIDWIECAEECHESCCNRPFVAGQLMTPRFRLQHYPRKHFGLKTMVRIYKDDFVMEYCGVVRQVAKEDEASMSPHELSYSYRIRGTDFVIDASSQGNASRYINHACDANLKAVTFVSEGTLKIMLVATRNIAAGEELTLNYRDVMEGNICYCAISNNCVYVPPSQEEPPCSAGEPQVPAKKKHALLNQERFGNDNESSASPVLSRTRANKKKKTQQLQPCSSSASSINNNVNPTTPTNAMFPRRGSSIQRLSQKLVKKVIQAIRKRGAENSHSREFTPCQETPSPKQVTPSPKQVTPPPKQITPCCAPETEGIIIPLQTKNPPPNTNDSPTEDPERTRELTPMPSPSDMDFDPWHGFALDMDMDIDEAFADELLADITLPETDPVPPLTPEIIPPCPTPCPPLPAPTTRPPNRRTTNRRPRTTRIAVNPGLVWGRYGGLLEVTTSVGATREHTPLLPILPPPTPPNPTPTTSPPTACITPPQETSSNNNNAIDKPRKKKPKQPKPILLEIIPATATSPTIIIPRIASKEIRPKKKANKNKPTKKECSSTTGESEPQPQQVSVQVDIGEAAGPSQPKPAKKTKKPTNKKVKPICEPVVAPTIEPQANEPDEPQQKVSVQVKVKPAKEPKTKPCPPKKKKAPPKKKNTKGVQPTGCEDESAVATTENADEPLPQVSVQVNVTDEPQPKPKKKPARKKKPTNKPSTSSTDAGQPTPQAQTQQRRPVRIVYRPIQGAVDVEDNLDDSDFVPPPPRRTRKRTRQTEPADQNDEPKQGPSRRLRREEGEDEQSDAPVAGPSSRQTGQATRLVRPDIGDDKRPHHCKTCNEKYMLKAHLDDHRERRHNNARNWPCEACRMPFKMKQDMQRHMREVHGPGSRNKPCKNPKCDAMFKRNDHVKRHMLLHCRYRFQTEEEPAVPAEVVEEMEQENPPQDEAVQGELDEDSTTEE